MIIPCSVMGEERDGTIIILMVACLDKQIPFKDEVESDICLTEGTRLHRAKANTSVFNYEESLPRCCRYS